MPFVPRLLSQVLPAMSNDVEQVRQAANQVNSSLMNYIMSLSDESTRAPPLAQVYPLPAAHLARETASLDRRDSSLTKGTRNGNKENLADKSDSQALTDAHAAGKLEGQSAVATDAPDLDYEAAVGALTLQFLNEHEATRVAALAWLIMLHRKAPRKVWFYVLSALSFIV